jgi:hypothetical protein
VPGVQAAAGERPPRRMTSERAGERYNRLRIRPPF